MFTMDKEYCVNAEGMAERGLKMLENLIIEKCAPTLANLKTGAIVNYRFKDLINAKMDVIRLNDKLSSRGVNIEILVERKNSLLLYVYRKNRLSCDLSCPLARSFLEKQGYASVDIGEAILMLRAKINRNGLKNKFPHEIGLFLSYPIQDVQGFIENQGKNCKHCGYWKVYGEEEKAALMFAKFDKCKEAYRRMCRQGVSINKLTVAC
ncbi:DUF3793 family protein [Aminipila sp.]|uniref:DUF3793 family protein n=1 Tax=Aminipila sp. TaxID=2060095 RepID=UPI0028990DFD|nr:DUF3793 family protein [Aminipila sp.]